MDIAAVLSLYDAQMRAQPPVPAGMALERDGGIVCLTGGFNYVCWWDLPANTARQAVADYSARYRSRGQALLWRIHEHDGPPELPSWLMEEGFEPDPPGTLMFLDLARADATAEPGIEVRRVEALQDLDGYILAGGKAFGQEEPWQRQAFAARLADPDLMMFVAYVAGEAAASARLEAQPGKSFGLMFGGGVAPEHRGKGLYRALVAARVEAARARGLSYLSTEARETSRPILERLGFTPVSRETIWALRP